MLPTSSHFKRDLKLNSRACSRRHFIKLASSAAGLTFASQVLGHNHKPQTMKDAPIGLQLYTLRDIMKVSVPATLKLVSSIGYKAPSAHIQLTDFDTQLTKILDDAQTVGHKYLVVPWLSEAQRGTGISPYQKLAEKLNTLGEACQKEGITLAYHNHDFEFENREGKIPLDVLIENTDPNNLAIELDLYWAVKANKDPIAYFKNYPGRFKLWHVKDMAKDGSFADVGTGVIDFENIFAHGKLAGIEHKFVERDQTNDRIATIEQGYKAVTALNHTLG